jgi:hypothetical protein
MSLGNSTENSLSPEKSKKESVQETLIDSEVILQRTAQIVSIQKVHSRMNQSTAMIAETILQATNSKHQQLVSALGKAETVAKRAEQETIEVLKLFGKVREQRQH